VVPVVAGSNPVDHPGRAHTAGPPTETGTSFAFLAQRSGKYFRNTLGPEPMDRQGDFSEGEEISAFA
jgi:hypothetical protein